MNELQAIKSISSYTRQEKLKQGMSCIVLPLPNNCVAKLFYLESEAWESFHNQLELYAYDLATRVYCSPRYIKLNNVETGGLSGEYWWYVCDKAEMIQPTNANRTLLSMRYKLEKVTTKQFDLYTIDNIGIYKGKLVLLDCLEEN